MAVWSHQGATLSKSPRSFFLTRAEQLYSGEIIGPSLYGVAPAVTENVTHKYASVVTCKPLF